MPGDELERQQHFIEEIMRTQWREDIMGLSRLIGRGVAPGELIQFALFEELERSIMSAEDVIAGADDPIRVHAIRVPYCPEPLSDDDRTFVQSRLHLRSQEESRRMQQNMMTSVNPVHLGADGNAGQLTLQHLENVMREIWDAASCGAVSRPQAASSVSMLEAQRVRARLMDEIQRDLQHIYRVEHGPPRLQDEYLNSLLRDEPPSEPPPLESYAEEVVQGQLEPMPCEALADAGLCQEEIEQRNTDAQRERLRARINAPMADRVHYESPNYVPDWAENLEDKK